MNWGMNGEREVFLKKIGSRCYFKLVAHFFSYGNRSVFCGSCVF